MWLPWLAVEGSGVCDEEEDGSIEERKRAGLELPWFCCALCTRDPCLLAVRKNNAFATNSLLTKEGITMHSITQQAAPRRAHFTALEIRSDPLMAPP